MLARGPEVEGGPLNQPGGHWERAAMCKLKGMRALVVQWGWASLH